MLCNVSLRMRGVASSMGLGVTECYGCFRRSTVVCVLAFAQTLKFLLFLYIYISCDTSSHIIRKYYSQMFQYIPYHPLWCTYSNTNAHILYDFQDDSWRTLKRVCVNIVSNVYKPALGLWLEPPSGRITEEML